MEAKQSKVSDTLEVRGASALTRGPAPGLLLETWSQLAMMHGYITQRNCAPPTSESRRFAQKVKSERRAVGILPARRTVPQAVTTTTSGCRSDSAPLPGSHFQTFGTYPQLKDRCMSEPSPPEVRGDPRRKRWTPGIFKQRFKHWHLLLAALLTYFASGSEAACLGRPSTVSTFGSTLGNVSLTSSGEWPCSTRWLRLITARAVGRTWRCPKFNRIAAY
jgi:hypothetical protein